MATFQSTACTLAALILAGAAHGAPPVSYFPAHDLGQFLANTFDLASIRSSFGPRRSPALRTFTDFGMKPSKATDDILVFDMPGDWFYEMRILGRGDFNKDGIEDLVVCFTDRAQNGGIYFTSQGLLVSRYAPDAYAVALNFDPVHDACPDYARHVPPSALTRTPSLR